MSLNRNNRRVLGWTLFLVVAMSPMWGHIYGTLDPVPPAASAMV